MGLPLKSGENFQMITGKILKIIVETTALGFFFFVFVLGELFSYLFP